MKNILIALSLSAILLLLIIPSYSSFAANTNSGNGDGESRVVSALGLAKVQGQEVIVDILVVVQPGQNANEVARAALQAQGARPFDSANLGSEGFTVTGLVWNNLPVVQNYNSQNEPNSLNGNGQAALTNTHTTWDGVATSDFDINDGGTTTRCPSLVRECPGPQTFDGNNDVSWLRLQRGVLGVTWFGTSTDEADMALSTRFNWNDGCTVVPNSFDAQTVFLHENGHVVGLGHSDDTSSVMLPRYSAANCSLGIDDDEGATFLYDNTITGSVSGTVTNTDGDPIESATVSLGGTSLQDTTDSNGVYSISGVPDPVTYDITASSGDGSETVRLKVNGAETDVDFVLTTSGDDGNGGGGGNCPPGNPNHPKCNP